jgi:hypothetical protein
MMTFPQYTKWFYKPIKLEQGRYFVVYLLGLDNAITMLTTMSLVKLA